MEQYLYKNSGTSLTKFIFGFRSKTTDIKTYQPYKYTDNLCSACEISEDNLKHLICCDKLRENNENNSDINIDIIYGNDEENIISVGKIIYKKYMQRKKMTEKEESDDKHPRASGERRDSS